MQTTNLNIRTDKAVKEQAELIFAELGLNMFLRSTIREHGIPFDLKLDVPNETTKAAFAEGEKMLADPNSPKYTNIEDLKAALDL